MLTEASSSTAGSLFFVLKVTGYEIRTQAATAVSGLDAPSSLVFKQKVR
jgi:hypothetical protein